MGPHLQPTCIQPLAWPPTSAATPALRLSLGDLALPQRRGRRGRACLCTSAMCLARRRRPWLRSPRRRRTSASPSSRRHP
eukprot:2455023-Alexandrium_andersonii.AAC.1